MGYKQYIGARYVPKLFENPNGTNEWLKGIEYEPLTIVTYMNVSYTSKTKVPPNIDILDTKYWVLTGSYNAQVTALSDLLNKVKKDLEDSKLSKVELESKVVNKTLFLNIKGDYK